MTTNNYWQGLRSGTITDSDIVVMGVPFDRAVSGAYGAAEAPGRLRELSAGALPFSETGLDLRQLMIYDHGDICYEDDWVNYYEEVEKQASSLIQTGNLPLFLGGDHSVTIPLSKAFAKHYYPEPVGMIHLDAHNDLMDIYQGKNWSHACPQRRFIEQKNARSENLFLVGIREFEAEELDYLKEHPEIGLVTAHSYYRDGHETVIDRMISAMHGLQAIYLSIDIDILDPAYAPGTGTPQAGGFSTRELIELVRDILSTLPVKAIDIVEVAPPLDYLNITSRAALKVIYEIFATSVSKKN